MKVIGLSGLIFSAGAFIVAIEMEQSILAVISFLIAAFFVTLLMIPLLRSEKAMPNELWTLSYPCQRTDFLRKRLKSVQKWQEDVRPEMEKILRLKPIIEDELGFRLIVFCLDGLDESYVSCDMLRDNKQGRYPTDVVCNKLIGAIVEEREMRERRRQRIEAKKRAIEKLKSDLSL